jgi:UPF0755 protein
MWKALAANALTVFIVLLAGAALTLNWAQREYRGAGPLASAVCVQVASGATMGAVSRDLVEQGALSNGALFRMGADYAKKSGQLKAGNFLIQPETSMEAIIETITRSGRSTCGTELNYRIGVLRPSVVVREFDPATGRYEDVMSFVPGQEDAPPDYEAVAAAPDVRFRVTLSEGVTSWEVVEALKAASFLEGALDAVPAEGSLAPDSYEVRRGDDRAELIAQMESRQTRILADLWAARQQDVPLQSPQEALVLASIVEKETAVAEERGQVASVFVNRLNQGIRLQTDPTVIYGITNGQGTLGRGLRRSELRGATPYNTYVIDGLPPTPIANPGVESIRAALNPDDTDFLFFVADGTGGHAFARTLAEHNSNVAKWRAIERARAQE